MKFQEWSKNKLIYDLGDGYLLKKAESNEYNDYYTIYFQMKNSNVWFKKSFDIMKSVLDEEDPCFWLVKDDKKIGGLFIEPNEIAELFFIPPYEGDDVIFEKLKEILVSWSDNSKDILVVNIPEPQILKGFEEIGFKKGEGGKWMIRPTENFKVSWEEDFYTSVLKRENQKEIGQLLYEAFEVNKNISESYTLEEYNEWVKEYFDEFLNEDILNRASTLVYDKKTNELVGVCYISLWQEWPLVSQIAVKPEYQGKGIGTGMLKVALNILKEEFCALRLYVEDGNEAEKVYSSLGFLKGNEIVELKLI